MEFKNTILSTFKLVFLFLFVLTICNCDDSKSTKNLNNGDIDENIGKDTYLRLLTIKRKSQLDAVKNIATMGKYEKQFKMVKLLLDKIVKVIINARSNLTESNYTISDGFPENETVRDYYAIIIENTMFFGDLILRFPDITKEIMKRETEYVPNIQWSHNFVINTNLFEGKQTKLLSLMAQELGIVDVDPDYENPYSEATKLKKEREEMEKIVRENGGKLNKKKKKQRKGPRISPRVDL